jgi:hypothetical protein
MKTFIQIPLPVLMLLVLAGCASKTWYHPTASESQFRQESALCERTASISNPGSPSVQNPYLDPFQKANAAIAQGSADLGRAFAMKNAYENCMAIKGYYAK